MNWWRASRCIVPPSTFKSDNCLPHSGVGMNGREHLRRIIEAIPEIGPGLSRLKAGAFGTSRWQLAYQLPQLRNKRKRLDRPLLAHFCQPSISPLTVPIEGMADQ